MCCVFDMFGLHIGVNNLTIYLLLVAVSGPSYSSYLFGARAFLVYLALVWFFFSLSQRKHCVRLGNGTPPLRDSTALTLFEADITLG